MSASLNVTSSCFSFLGNGPPFVQIQQFQVLQIANFSRQTVQLIGTQIQYLQILKFANFRRNFTKCPTITAEGKTQKAWLDSLKAEIKTLEVDSLKDLAEIKKLEEEKTALKAKTLLEASKFLAVNELPENFDALIPLDSLDCSGWGLDFLSPEIGKLQNLTKLNLRGNQLTSLPAEIWELKNLTNLNLSFISLTALPAEIGELKKLTWLIL